MTGVLLEFDQFLASRTAETIAVVALVSAAFAAWAIREVRRMSLNLQRLADHSDTSSKEVAHMAASLNRLSESVERYVTVALTVNLPKRYEVFLRNIEIFPPSPTASGVIIFEVVNRSGASILLQRLTADIDGEIEIDALKNYPIPADFTAAPVDAILPADKPVGELAELTVWFIDFSGRPWKVNKGVGLAVPVPPDDQDSTAETGGDIAETETSLEPAPQQLKAGDPEPVEGVTTSDPSEPPAS